MRFLFLNEIFIKNLQYIDTLLLLNLKFAIKIAIKVFKIYFYINIK